MFAIEAKEWAIDEDSTNVVTVPTPVRSLGGEPILTGQALALTSLSSLLDIEHQFFAIPPQVGRVVDEAPPAIGRRWPQASGADAATGLAVTSSLPVLLLMLPAAVVDPKN